MFLEFDCERKKERQRTLNTSIFSCEGVRERCVLGCPPPRWPWLTAHVLAGDGNKLILRKGNGPCEGHLQVYHSGEWGHVGDKYWNNNKTVEVVCRSTNCGEPVSWREMLRPIGSKVWLNELRCNGSESHLWDCPHPGWGTSVFQKDTMMEVTCSSKAWLSVYYKKGSKSYSEHKISQQGWGWL